MWCSPSVPARTVGDVLRTPVTAKTSCRSLPPLTPATTTQRHPCASRPDSAISHAGAGLFVAPQRPRLQSAPGARRSTCVPRPATARQSLRCASAGAEGVRVRGAALTRSGQPTRRPIDEAIFCALRMEAEPAVAAQLRGLGPARLTSDFRGLCSRLSLHNVTAAQFCFLCAAVLEVPVEQRDCDVVFACLRGETSTGSLDVAELLTRLRTLFVPPPVLSALQLKRMLETNALSECVVSLDELRKGVEGVQALLPAAELQSCVGEQWASLQAELTRIHVQYATLVPTFRLTARRLAPVLCAAVNALGWDGQMDEAAAALAMHSARSSAAGTTASSRSSSPPPVTMETAEPAALLSAVTERYRQRLSKRGGETGGSPHLAFAAAAARVRQRRSTWRAADSAVDATSPHFVADAYATGQVLCAQE